MTFQRVVIIIAIIILIIILFLIGLALHKSTGQPWPPIVGDCPDYWIDLSGNGTNCVDVKDLAKSKCPSVGTEHLNMNFNVPGFQGTNGLCSKYKWANSCGVSWDGITYGSQNPCDTSQGSYLT
jgi:hypothetical protein